LLRGPSNLALNVSRERASTTSLGNPFQCCHHPHGKKLCPYIQSESTFFYFKTITTCPTTTGPDKKFVPSFLQAPFGHWKATTRPPRSPLQAEQPQLPQPVLAG